MTESNHTFTNTNAALQKPIYVTNHINVLPITKINKMMAFDHIFKPVDMLWYAFIKRVASENKNPDNVVSFEGF